MAANKSTWSPEAEKLRKKHTGRIPVIVRWKPDRPEKKEQVKLLVPENMTVPNFKATIKGKGVPENLLSKLVLENSITGESVYVFDGGLDVKNVKHLDQLFIGDDGFLTLYVLPSDDDGHVEEAEPEVPKISSPVEDSSLPAPPAPVATPSSPKGASGDGMGLDALGLESIAMTEMKSEPTVFSMADMADDETTTSGGVDCDWDMWCEEASSVKGKSAEARRVSEKWPNRVPVHCLEADSVPPNIRKLLPPATMTLHQFENILYKQFRGSEVNNKDRPPIRIFVGSMQLCQAKQTMKETFNLYRANTGLLHITVKFGGDEERERLEEELRQSRAELLERSTEKEELLEQVDKAKHARDAAEQKTREAQSECINLELAMQQLVSDDKEKGERIEVLQAHLLEKSSECVALQGELQARAENESEQAKLCEELQAQKEKNAATNREAAEKAQVVQLLETQLNDTRKELQALRDEHIAAIKAMHDEVAQAKEDAQKAQEELEAQGRQKARLEADLREQREKEEGMQALQREQDATNKLLREQVAQVGRQVQKAEEELEGQSRQRKRVEAELRELKEKHDSLKAGMATPASHKDSGDDEFVMVPENRDICGSV